jgi:hypothetical protein
VVESRHGECRNCEGIGMGSGRKCQLIVVIEKRNGWDFL